MSTTAPSGPMTPQRFISIWSKAKLSERAASHEHFIHLCQMLGQPTPASHDATGAEYTFEKGVSVTNGASKGAKGAYGFADVWWKGKFAWEYKRTLTNLYNERPTWLKLAHEQIDRAVLAAYAAADPDGGWCEDWAEVWKDAGAGQPQGHELASRRAEVEQQVLGNLLRLNQSR